MASWCTRTVGADWFNAASFGVIIVNAVMLGLETYDRAVERAGTVLVAIEYACLACFAIELLLRFGAHLTAPRGFLRDGWNIFDLLIVCAPLLPGVRENVSLLRLARLARIVRAIRLFPSLRVIIGGVLRSLPGLGSFLLIATLTIYLYAMVGWMAFGDAYPDRYGTVGQAMLTLFLLLSLDGVTDALEAGRLVSDWAIVYYASYIVVASYLLTNLLIGIVLKALEEAHLAEQPGPSAAGPGTGPGTPPGPVPAPAPAGPPGTAVGAATAPAGTPVAAVAATARSGAAEAADPESIGNRLRDLRAALEALEAELARQQRADPPGRPGGKSGGRRSKGRRTAANAHG
ncbi:ion transporter [Micromonospora sp. NPDC049559]|uniref:ion transporter n=1 Tax=Micromonospora sp. NPDC049559 TaxID=3155923 RepID=UPI003419469D